MAGLIGLGALGAFAAAVFLATGFIVKQLVPLGARRWATFPIAGLLVVLPFADELYYAQQTRRACETDGGFAVTHTILAKSRESGIAQIETVKLDTEEAYYWKHELRFIDRATGDELGRLRWFDRKHGWLQGNEPGSGYGAFLKGPSCPDPQPFLANATARAELVRTR